MQKKSFIIVVTFTFAFFLFRTWYWGILFHPPLDNDEVMFDALAANLAAGRGFTAAPSEEFLAAYRPYAAEYDLSSVLSAEGGYREEVRRLGADGSTTFRPPLFPTLLSAVYAAGGPRFVSARVLNCLFLALGSALLFSAVRRRGTLVPAALIAALVAVDPHVFAFSRLGLSEALGFFLAALVLKRLLRSAQSGTAAAVTGTLYGLLILARPVFLFWLPAVALYTALAPRERGVRRAVTLVLTAAAVYLPWGVRNSLLLEGFYPFGSQGPIVLGTISRPDALNSGGNWTHSAGEEFLAAFESDKSSTERERALVAFSEERFRAWKAAHGGEMPRLWLARAASFWWNDIMPYQRVLAAAALLAAAVLAFRRDRGALLVLFLAANTAGIALTYNAGDLGTGLYGRFLFSLYPVFFLLIGTACARRQESAGVS